ncbi:hypothetical protein EUBVEN_01578 [Eubacterium ventriosum ATCC 27560]|uniref:Uncharacterized protein n=1 Tax=Eubacterium ventriosum ATCC 27560 TaxID=411463 RepID=A5Z796_9FIRM|nr:hypothetical protein EUBVEN_01578 [Eubacterium ventriosum ATCC 27560]
MICDFDFVCVCRATPCSSLGTVIAVRIRIPCSF